MRSPTWISPPFGGEVLREEVKHGVREDMSNRQYTFSDEEKRLFREDTDGHLKLRQKIEAEINLNFPLYIKGTNLQKKTYDTMRNEMEKRIGTGHEELKVWLFLLQIIIRLSDVFLETSDTILASRLSKNYSR